MSLSGLRNFKSPSDATSPSSRILPSLVNSRIALGGTAALVVLFEDEPAFFGADFDFLAVDFVTVPSGLAAGAVVGVGAGAVTTGVHRPTSFAGGSPAAAGKAMHNRIPTVSGTLDSRMAVPQVDDRVSPAPLSRALATNL